MAKVVARVRLVAVFVLIVVMGPASVAAQPGDDPRVSAKRAAAVGEIVTFENGAFPFDKTIPEQNIPFLETDEQGRRFHLSPRGGKLFAKETYSDGRSLLFAPKWFDPNKPDAAIVLFFHGNLATLETVRGRQAVPRQLAASGLNAVLVAPQLAVNALDSSPGRFYEPDFLPLYLSEVASQLAARSDGHFDAAAIERLPVIIVAYSGGYLATAFSLHYAGGKSRIRGVILLDALFGEQRKIEDWIVKTHARTFLVAAYSAASRTETLAFQDDLGARGVPPTTRLPAALGAGDVVVIAAPGALHNDFVTMAWTKDPLADVLARVRAGTAREPDTR